MTASKATAGLDGARLRFAVGVPNVGDYASPQLLRDLACTAEEAGWDGFFLWDHLLYRNEWPVTDPWIALAGVAAATRTMRLAIMVAALPRQHPGEVAKRGTSLDHLSNGRFTLGAGLGSIPLEFTAFNQSPDPRTRAELLDESLRVIDTMWRGAPVDFSGWHHEVHTPRMPPVPLQQPRIPIWIGGRWPRHRPFRRAAAWDGVVPTHVAYGKGETMPPAALADVVSFVQAHRQAHRPFDVAVEGTTPGAAVGEYARAGLTWWIEALGWWRGPVARSFGRVRAGPPRLE